MTKRTGRPAGRPKLYEKRVCIGFTAMQLKAIKRLMDRDGLTFNDAVREFLDKAITTKEQAA